MGKGDSCVTTGYRYYAGLHLVVCHAMDALLGIRCGEKWAWNGTITNNTALNINQPDLFGGEAREGGVVGTVDICFGGPGQQPNDYLAAKLGPVPAFRGLFAVVARHCMLSTGNPYVKPWTFLGRRTRMGWRDDLADIADEDGHIGMNPAHIILEAVTNTTWGGLGYPMSDIDLASFQTAANLLKAEGFGISIIWGKPSSIEDFIDTICRHIDAQVFFSHTTGLLKLKLIRNDFDAGAIPRLNESNIIELVDLTAPTVTEAINQVTVNWVDRDNQQQAITVQDIAGLARTDGQVNSTNVDFPGIASPRLAAHVAARVLQQSCMPIASCTLTVNRTVALDPGDCFSFSWAPLGIDSMVMRVASMEVGELTDGPLRIKAVRDVFGLGAISITNPEFSQWVDPISDPKPAANRRVEELTWWQFVQGFTDAAAVTAELEDHSTMVQSWCSRPSSDAINYELWTRNTGQTDWTLRDTDSFPWHGSLALAVVPEISTTLQMAEPIDAMMVRVGAYAFLENEMVAITGVNAAIGTITVDRGILDTIPVAHAAGAVLACCQNLYGLDQTPRVEGEAVEARILPATARGRLALTAAPIDAIATRGRMMRPYPPGNVRINGARWPAAIGAAAELTLAWATRDRTMQTVRFNRQDEGDIGPEPGATTTLRIYGETGAPLRTVTGLTATAYTYAAAAEQADSGFTPPRLNTSLRIELESVRGPLTSLQQWNLSVRRQ